MTSESSIQFHNWSISYLLKWILKNNHIRTRRKSSQPLPTVVFQVCCVLCTQLHSLPPSLHNLHSRKSCPSASLYSMTSVEKCVEHGVVCVGNIVVIIFNKPPPFYWLLGKCKSVLTPGGKWLFAIRDCRRLPCLEHGLEVTEMIGLPPERLEVTIITTISASECVWLRAQDRTDDSQLYLYTLWAAVHFIKTGLARLSKAEGRRLVLQLSHRNRE